MEGKKILVGITGGIAAYKAAILIRGLVKQDAHVKAIMTSYAKDFITPLSISTVSKNPVYQNFFDEQTGEWVDHVALANWADAFLVAPLTANTLAKICSGFCDNLLLATYLSATCPVFFAPAMDRAMYNHPAVQKNLEQVTKWGHRLIGPEEGELASGLSGKGRMSEPEAIVEHLNHFFSSN